MTRFRTRFGGRFILLATLALGGSSLAVNCSSSNHSQQAETGSLSLALSVPGGIVVQTVDYTVSSAANPSVVTGTFNVADPNATVSLDLALPQGHYDIALTAHTNVGQPTDHTFSGTTATLTPAGFNITPGNTTTVALTLTDSAVLPGSPTGIARVSATVVANDNPPVIDRVVVAPAQTSASANIGVTVVAHDPDGDALTYLWTATPDGSYAAPATATTTYQSPTGGSKTLTITVTDSRGASIAVQLPVTIIGTPGTGGAGGAVGSGGSAGGTVGTGGAVGGSAGGTVGTGGAVGGSAGGTVGTGGAVGGSAGGTVGTGGTGGAVGGSAGGTVGTGGAVGGSAGGTVGSGGAVGTGGATGGTAGPTALEIAELAITDFDQNLLTATHSQDPDTGDQTPIGWGPTTLPSAEQRTAAIALIRRIASLLPASARNATNSGPYTSSSVNVLNALLTLNSDPSSLFAGTNLAPRAATALDAYEAGATADTFAPTGQGYLAGVAAGASDATYGAYISGNGTDPEGVAGLVTNIVKAALLHGLEAQLHAY